MAQRLSGPSLLRTVEPGATLAPRRLGPLRHATPAASSPVAPVRSAAAAMAPEAVPDAPAAEPQLPESVVAARLREAAETAWRRGRLEGLEEGREQGRREGLAEGRAEAVRDHARSQQQLAEALQAAGRSLQERLANAEALATALARQTLEQLLGEPAARATLLSDLLRHRLAAVAEGSELTVRLHPDDLQDLGGGDSLQARLQQPQGPRLHLRADPTLPRGGCCFDLALGRLDAGLDTALELIRRHFQDAGDHDAGA